MTRVDFIIKLKEKSFDNKNTHWKQSFSDSEDFWTLYRPSLNWMEDDMTVHDLNVTIVYSERFYDDPKQINMSFDDFINNYSNSVSLF